MWQLKRPVYGLCDASRGFYIALTNELLKLGCQKLQLDSVMFIFYTNEDCNSELREPNDMLVYHVDDLLRAGDQSFKDTVISPLKAIFAFKSDNDFDFRSAGLHIEQVAKGINVDQNHYLRSLELPDFHELSSAQLDNELCADMQSLFRSVVGKITNISFTSRPDLCFYAKSMISKYGKATVKDVKSVIKKLILVKNSGDSKMLFPDLGDISAWAVVGHADAGVKTMPDKVTCRGKRFDAL